MLGASEDPDGSRTPRRLAWAAAAIPVLAAGAAAVAFSIDRGAGVGVLVGLMLALPMGLVVRSTGGQPFLRSWASITMIPLGPRT